jgi:hypothetical protein
MPRGGDVGHLPKAIAIGPSTLPRFVVTADLMH